MKKYLINARLPAKLNYVYFHSKSIEISRNSNEIFFVFFFKDCLGTHRLDCNFPNGNKREEEEEEGISRPE